MKLVMGYTKSGEQMHLVDGDDLAVGLCGVRIAHHVRQMVKGMPLGTGPLVLYADHWSPGSLGTSSRNGTCDHCVRVLERSSR